MTCKEKLKNDYPMDFIHRLCKDCPSDYGYADYPGGDVCRPFANACEDCWNREVKSNYKKPKDNPIRFKIFFGDHNTMSSSTADNKANIWMKTTPNIEIVDFRYSESNGKSHSICIMYKEVKE